jgi:uncharacterized protein (DUF362 family)
MIRANFYKCGGDVEYPQRPPFDPAEQYPEIFLRDVYAEIDKTNRIYGIVRDLLYGLKLDFKNFGRPEWNPLSDLVGEGQTILIKPNLVTHKHMRGDNAVFCTVTHPSIIRVFIDYALFAVGRSGRIIVGDTPIENCDFDILCDIVGLRQMVTQLKNRGYDNLELIDFRTYKTTQNLDSTVIRTDLPGDPRGYTNIDLGRSSLFQNLEDTLGEQNYYTLGDHSVDHMNPRENRPGLPNNYHYSGTHIYRIPNSILSSDLVINIAKLKTHKFSGVTLCLKNAIGICQGKEYLPHRRPGSVKDGGDSFPKLPSFRYVGSLRLKRAFYKILGKSATNFIHTIYRSIIPSKLPHEVYMEPLFGDWYGNDTVWRTTLDLNLILFHADVNGIDLTRRMRNYLGFIDGIMGMDHEAPMAGLPVRSNILIAGRDPVAVDTLGTYLMGFDPGKIPTITGPRAEQCWALGDIKLDRHQVIGNTSLEEARSKFVATKGWQNLLKQSTLQSPFDNG